MILYCNREDCAHKYACKDSTRLESEIVQDRAGNFSWKCHFGKFHMANLDRVFRFIDFEKTSLLACRIYVEEKY